MMLSFAIIMSSILLSSSRITAALSSNRLSFCRKRNHHRLLSFRHATSHPPPSTEVETTTSKTTNGNKNKKCIYLDYNGTTPIHKRVIEAMMPYFTQHFGNPSSSHYYGIMPKEAVAKARTAILSLLYNKDESTKSLQDKHDSIIFTGCGTEADNLAIHLALQANPHVSKPHIVTSNVEHPAITQYLNALEEENKITVTYVPVNNEGIVSARDMINAVTRDTVLVTLMLANNECGSIQPIKEVSSYCQEKSILFHTDAAQAVGKISIALSDEGIGDAVDMITIVGHKFGAPKGIACLYVKPKCFTTKGNRVEPKHYMLLGGGQEGGKRAGTENIPYIVAMGVAADILIEERTKSIEGEKHENDSSDSKLQQWQENALRMKILRNRLFQNLVRGLGEDTIRDNGPRNEHHRLPNTLSVGFKNIQSAELLQNIQMDVACSAGSACHSSGGPKISPVLEAMKVPLEYARGTLRLSVGPATTRDEIDEASDIIIQGVKKQLS